MHIAVFVKQVPEQNSVKITGDNAIDATGIDQIINLFDEYAIEEALQWAEKVDGKVTVISIGERDAGEQLKKALAMGATEALMVQDSGLDQLGAQAVARIGAAAIQKLGDVDVVFCGKQSTDDETAQFGPALARFLGWPQLTYVFKVHSLADGRIKVDRALEETLETVSCSLPAVVTAVKDLNEPRYPSLLKIRKVAKTTIPTMSLGDLGLDAAQLRGHVRIAGRTPPPPRPRGEMVDGVEALVQKLIDSQVL